MLNVTIVDGTTRVGAHAADGSINVVESNGSGYKGHQHPSGAWYVTVSGGIQLLPNRAPDGSLYVIESTTVFNSGTQIHINSGSFGGGSGPGGVGSPMGLLLALTYAA